MSNSIVRSPLFAEFDQLFSQIASQYPTQTSRSSQLYVRPVYVKDGSAIAEVEVPGVEPSEVKVRIEGKSLTVETPKGNAYVTIGQRLDPEGATASLKYGLLTIRIPTRSAKVVEVSVHEE